MNKIKTLLWDNAGAIFCYSVAIMILISVILMDVYGIITVTM